MAYNDFRKEEIELKSKSLLVWYLQFQILESIFFFQKIESIIRLTLIKHYTNNCLELKKIYIFKDESRWNYYYALKKSRRVKIQFEPDRRYLEFMAGQNFTRWNRDPCIINRRRVNWETRAPAEREGTMKYRGSVDARLIGEKWKEKPSCVSSDDY